MKRLWEMAETKAGRFPAGFAPRKFCTWMQNQSFCQKGDACTFAHTAEELAPESGGASRPTDEAVNGEPIVQIEASMPAAVQDSQNAVSSTLAPRMFEGNFKPSCLCKMWIQHPTYCAHGDSCTFAHGVAELSQDLHVVLENIAATGLLGAKTANELGAFSAVDFGWGKMGKSRYKVGSPGTSGQGGKADAGLAAAVYTGARQPLKGKGVAVSRRTSGSSLSENGFSLSSSQFETRFSATDFKPNKICTYWLQDPSTCTKGDMCSFAHGVLELILGAGYRRHLHPQAIANCGINRFTHTGFKPRVMCRNVGTDTGCLKGLLCSFTHSAEEML
mmetsp:Transcript_67145/g.148975  ORF Transcript_67145/g.148975 Transcript_67145/m.148975 type:complete len:332 (-) Transcript_67145:33-1028(-)